MAPQVRGKVTPHVILVMPNAWKVSRWAISAFAAVRLRRPRIVAASAAAAAADAAGGTKTLLHAHAAGGTKSLLHHEAEGVNTAAVEDCHPRRLSNSPTRERYRFQSPVPQTWSVPASAPRSASRIEVEAPAVQNAEEDRGQKTQTTPNEFGAAAVAVAAPVLASVVMLLVWKRELSWCCTQLAWPASCAVGLTGLTPSNGHCGRVEGCRTHKPCEDCGGAVLRCSHCVAGAADGLGGGWDLQGCVVVRVVELQLDWRSCSAC